MSIIAFISCIPTSSCVFCHQGAVTHRNNNTVAEQTFDWTAPPTPLGAGTELEAVLVAEYML